MTSYNHHLYSNYAARINMMQPTKKLRLRRIESHAGTCWERGNKITMFFILPIGPTRCSQSALQILQGLPGHLQRCSSLVTSLIRHHTLQPRKVSASTRIAVICMLRRKPLLTQIGHDASFLPTMLLSSLREILLIYEAQVLPCITYTLMCAF